MSVMTVIVLVFSLLGAADLLFGDRLGLGSEFKRGLSLFCPMVLSMLGMIVIAPAVGEWITPVLNGFYHATGIDPSIIPASLFSNDMGGAPLAQSVAQAENVGNFNAFIVASMMGCIISYSIPYALGVVKHEQYDDMFFGFLCGIVTIPIGCFVSGLICGLSALTILFDLLPLLILATVIVLMLIFVPRVCIACFSVFGRLVKGIAIVGMACAIFTFFTKVEISPHFESLENAAFICVNASVTMSGTLPFMAVVSRLLRRPMHAFGKKLGVNNASAFAFLSNLVTNATTFDAMEKMDKKGTVLNAAFAVSAAFVLGGQLAFTMAYDSRYVLPMIVGKLVAGVCGVALAALLYKHKEKTT